jgi:Ca2+-binding EF-hand superfamily protein
MAFLPRRRTLPVAPLVSPFGDKTVTHRLLLTAFLATGAASALAQNTTAPAQAPQPVSRTTYMQKVDSSFVTVDSNKDGFMDRAEIEAAETKALSGRKAVMLRDREGAFRKMDANKDGSLTLQEYNAALAAVQLRKADATPVLNRLDTNKDGKVSLAENRVPSMAQFDRADANKDGTLTAAELKAPGKR